MLGGCGTSYYDGKFVQRAKKLDLASAFAPLWPGASEIPGTNLYIRVPKFFDRAYNRSSNYTDDENGEIDPERLNPPFLNPFPGLLGCYEAFAKIASGESIPVYLYAGVRVIGGEGKAGFQQELADKLQKLDPQAHWEDITVRDPEDNPVNWKVITASFTQPFFPQGHGRKDAKQLPGFFQLWWFDAPTGVVLLGWRAADETATANNYRKLAELTAGTLHAEEKPAEEKPADAPAADAGS